jgi:hypothetical protein
MASVFYLVYASWKVSHQNSKQLTPRYTLHKMKAFLSYLARDKIYKQEKSFSTDFPVDHIPGARGTNGTGDERLVTMRDIRQCPDIKLDTAGFCLVNFHSRFSADDLVYDEEAKFGYWKEIQQLILSTFPEYKRVECHDLTVSLLYQSSCLSVCLNITIDQEKSRRVPSTSDRRFQISGNYVRTAGFESSQRHHSTYV